MDPAMQWRSATELSPPQQMTCSSVQMRAVKIYYRGDEALFEIKTAIIIILSSAHAKMVEIITIKTDINTTQ